MRTTITKCLLALSLLGTVYAANWAIENHDPISVGFGLTAPAGVLFAGLAFGLRDALHEAAGRLVVVVAILGGAALSFLISDAVTIPGGHVSIAVASGLAFLISEMADLAVYSPLRERSWPAAVAASNVIGAVVDSALFLWLAFGSLDFLAGQILGKSYMIALALPVVWWVRRQREPILAV